MTSFPHFIEGKFSKHNIAAHSTDNTNSQRYIEYNETIETQHTKQPPERHKNVSTINSNDNLLNYKK
jgi:hypothetical protein